ncbi:MAG: cation:proton antiporter [Anaerolineae bacterium]|nr:cation:proton antiporter [Anaerolineae bacterium]
MSPFLQLALALVVIITAAKAGGYLSYRLGQPSVLGELLVGLILGPSVLDFLHLPFFTPEAHTGDTIAELAEFGVLLLMFIAGLELHLSDLAKAGRVSALAGTLGVIMPVLMGFGLGRMFELSMNSSLFLGLILAATSVSISAQTLMELDKLRSRVGISMLGAAVFDDVLVVLGLSLFVALAGENAGSSGLADVAVILLRMVGYLAIASIAGFYLLPDRLARAVERLPISRGLIAFVFTTMLLYAWGAEALGSMAAITGAFLAGLIFSRSSLKERIDNGMSILAYGVFVPIFFVNIGLVANARDLDGDSMILMVAMTAVAVVSKVLGAGLGARLGGLTNRESLQLGVGMMSRGEVGLIVVNVGVAAGFVKSNVFAAVVGVVILTTLLTPPMLRALFIRNPSEQKSN